MIQANQKMPRMRRADDETPNGERPKAILVFARRRQALRAWLVHHGFIAPYAFSLGRALSMMYARHKVDLG
jgi:hypothetical protein